ncbi:MAG: tartrate dehydrogenase [Gemmatimonadota bacterium]
MGDTHRIAVIPGDGIGREVVDEGMRVLEAAGSRYGIDFVWQSFPWGCDYYRETGRMMPEDGIEQLRPFDAIYLGAVGAPGVPDHVSLWGLLLPIRRGFHQAINLRPVRLFEGVASPLAGRGPGDIDLVVVRENSEGEYSELGGRVFAGTDREVVLQTSVFTRAGVDRVMRYAFELAVSRPDRHLTAATKSNGIIHTMPFWDERFEALAAEYDDVRADRYHIDALTAQLVRAPDRFDVLVGSNLFGDILSDLAPALAGSLALAPSANIDPDGDNPGMFEPVHGSAPDIAGQGIANPIGQIWSGALMLRDLGHDDAADAIERAIATALAEPALHTADLGGRARTEEVGSAVAGLVE